MRALFPDVSGRDFLDPGCGHGWHCRYAAEQGAVQRGGTMLLVKAQKTGAR